jgi:hypothetical protein
MDRMNHLWPDIAALTPRLVAVNWMACTHTLDALQFKTLARQKGRLSSLRLRCTNAVSQGHDLVEAQSDSDEPEQRVGLSPALVARLGGPFHDRVAALAWVCKHGNLAMCRVLRQWGVRVQDIRNDMGPTLGVAANRGHYCIFQELKQWTTPLDDGGLDHLTVEDLRYEINLILANAAYGGNLDLCQLMKDWRDLAPRPDGTWDCLTIQDVRDYENQTLGGAAEAGHVRVLQFLKDWRDPNGNRLTIEDVREGDNLALRVAARNGHANVLVFFKNWVDTSGDRLTAEDVRAAGNTALMWAAERGHLDVLVVLKNWVDASGECLTLADVRTDNNYALRCAARKGRLEICQFLKDWRDHNTSLTAETSLGLRDLHDFAIIHPAWPDSVPKERDHNALQLAQENGHTHVHKFLKDWETQEIATIWGLRLSSLFHPS